MTIVFKEKELVVPPSVRRQAGIKTGDRLEFNVSEGVITIVQKPARADDDEYTPEQRRIVDAQIAEGLEDIRKGRVSRRFNTVDEMLSSLKRRRQKTLGAG